MEISCHCTAQLASITKESSHELAEAKWGKGGTCRAVRCRRCRRRRLMEWNTWPRCTARPSVIQPRMAAPTDAARSTRRTSEPSCPGSSRGPSAQRGGGGGGGGAVALLPELVKNPAAGTGSGGRRYRSSSISASRLRRGGGPSTAGWGACLA